MAGLAYAIYFVLFRRRTGSPRNPIAALIAINVATLAVGLTARLATSTLDLTPTTATLGWHPAGVPAGR